jgi:hypothetical protein
MPWKVAAVTPLGEVVKGFGAVSVVETGEAGVAGSTLPAVAGSALPAATPLASAEGFHVGSVGIAPRVLAADDTRDGDELRCVKVARAGGRLGGATTALSPPVLTGADALECVLIAAAAVAAVALAKPGKCPTLAKPPPAEVPPEEAEGANTLDLEDTSGPCVTSGAVHLLAPDAANALGAAAALALAVPESDPGAPWRTEDTSAAHRQMLAANPPAWMGVKRF